MQHFVPEGLVWYLEAFKRFRAYFTPCHFSRGQFVPTQKSQYESHFILRRFIRIHSSTEIPITEHLVCFPGLQSRSSSYGLGGCYYRLHIVLVLYFAYVMDAPFEVVFLISFIFFLFFLENVIFS